MKQRTGEPWMSPAEYGRSLRGLTVNLLVGDIDAALRFQLREVYLLDPDGYVWVVDRPDGPADAAQRS